MTKKVLLTGFEPFGGESINPAWELAQSFRDGGIEGVDIVVQQLPTVFGLSLKVLEETLDATLPDVVICLGEAGGRSAISVERIGVNLEHARIPDNGGNQPHNRPVIGDGPAGYFSTLPVPDLVELLTGAGIPAEQSMTAGTYVCNHVLYGLLHLLARDKYRQQGTIGGFIHVPYLPEQAVHHKNAPSLGLDVLQRGLRLVIERVARTA